MHVYYFYFIFNTWAEEGTALKRLLAHHFFYDDPTWMLFYFTFSTLSFLLVRLHLHLYVCTCVIFIICYIGK